MDLSFLNSPYVSLAIAIGAILFPLYLAARSAAEFVGKFHGDIRRVLAATLYAIPLGFVSYEIDKVLHFSITNALATNFGMSLPQTTYGVLSGVMFFGITASTPLVGRDEHARPSVLIWIFTFIAGVSGAVSYAISAIYSVSEFHWFGGKLGTTLLIIVAVLGFIVGGAGAYAFMRYLVATADDDPDASKYGAVYGICALIGFVFTVPFFIALFLALGVWGFLAYIGITTGIFIVLVLLEAGLRALPAWVLVTLAVLITIAFQLWRGYGSILAVFGR